MPRRNRIDESLLTVEELAEMLNISRPSVYRRLKEGRIPQPIRFGRCVRWNQWRIQEWLDEGAPPEKGAATRAVEHHPSPAHAPQVAKEASA